MSFYVEQGEEPYVFTGDALFVGDVGRPDLRDMHADPRAMASALYDTLHQVLYRLPEETIVYPAHGAGSLCGRKLGSAPSTTQCGLPTPTATTDSTALSTNTQALPAPARPLHPMRFARNCWRPAGR